MLFNVVHIYVQGYETPGIRFNKNIDWLLTWQCQRWLLCLVATILQHNYDYLHREQLYQYLQVSPSFVHFLLCRPTDMQFIILNTTIFEAIKQRTSMLPNKIYNLTGLMCGGIYFQFPVWFLIKINLRFIIAFPPPTQFYPIPRSTGCEIIFSLTKFIFIWPPK